MSWLTSCSSTNLVETQKDSVCEQISYIVGATVGGTEFVGSIKTTGRIRTVTTIEYRGVDQATADAYVDSNPAGSTYTPAGETVPIGFWTNVKSSRSVRDGEGGAYKVVKETEVIYDWA